jgi:hypothetical protein
MLVVGHNCPGCGLDTPAVACAACRAPVVWDRQRGSRCAACGLAAPHFTCPECGLHTALDLEPAEAVPGPAGAADDVAGPARAPALRPFAVAALAALHGLLIALVVGGHDGGGPARDVAVAAAPPPSARIARGAVHLPPDAMPVPLRLPPPSSEPPPPSLASAPQPASSAPTATRPGRTPLREDWLSRLMRSRGATASAGHVPADDGGARY